MSRLLLRAAGAPPTKDLWAGVRTQLRADPLRSEEAGLSIHKLSSITSWGPHSRVFTPSHLWPACMATKHTTAMGSPHTEGHRSWQQKAISLFRNYEWGGGVSEASTASTIRIYDLIKITSNIWKIADNTEQKWWVQRRYTTWEVVGVCAQYKGRYSRRHCSQSARPVCSSASHHNQQLNMLHPPAYSPLCSATSSIMAAPQNFFLLTPLPGP